MAEFNGHGNYKAGIHEVDFKWIKQNLVDQFPSSKTRNTNLNGFLDFLDYLDLNGILPKKNISSVWIDGSFATNKLDPNDIDTIIFLDLSVPVLDQLNKKISEYSNIFRNFQTTFQQIGVSNFHSHVFLVLDPDTVISDLEEYPEVQQLYGQLDYQKKYWMGQFTFDRDELPKGVFKIKGGDL